MPLINGSILSRPADFNYFEPVRLISLQHFRIEARFRDVVKNLSAPRYSDAGDVTPLFSVKAETINAASLHVLSLSLFNLKRKTIKSRRTSQ